MNIFDDFYNKFNTFLVDEMLLNKTNNIFRTQTVNKKYNFINTLNTILLTENEYDELIDKYLSFQMKNKYLNYNYYEDLYVNNETKAISYNNLINKPNLKTQKLR